MRRAALTPNPIPSLGLGLRREFLDQVLTELPAVAQWEIAPENWMGRGNLAEYQLDYLRDHYPISSHGLSLSIGSQDPLDEAFLLRLKAFLDRFSINRYSEHLSYCSVGGHLYDLLPIPFTEAAAEHVIARVRRVQEIIERPLVLENISYYASAATELDELSFIKRILQGADCELLLDVNNVYVNSINQGYDPHQFICELPSSRITYGHIAGHHEEAPDLLIDTHGAGVKPAVVELLQLAQQVHGPFAVVLERDFNIPPLGELLNELYELDQQLQPLGEALHGN